MNLTMLPFEECDNDAAEAIAKANGRDDDNCAYTSTSAIIGLEYFRRWQGDTKTFCIIKTKELGFLVIKDLEDMNIRDDMQARFPHLRID